MFNIHCLLKRNNLFWFFRYYKNNLNKKVVNLKITTDSNLIISILLRKLLKKRNIFSLQLNISSKNLTIKLIKKIDKVCKKSFFLLGVDFHSIFFDKTYILEKIKFPCLALNYANDKKFKLFVINKEEDRKIFNVLCNYYDFPFIECEFTSCVGKNIFIKGKTCSPCKFFEVKQIINPDNVANFFISNTQMTKKLKDAVLKREKCKNSCHYFSYCKGGCLLNSKICNKKDMESITKNIINYSDNSNIFKEMNILSKVKK